MNRSLSRALRALATGVVLASTCTAARSQLVPLGPEVAVDPDPGAYLECPRIAGRPDGSFALAWLRADAGGLDGTLLVRAADAGGTLATEQRIADNVDFYTALPTLEPLGPGYQLLWQHTAAGANEVRVQQLAANGARSGPRHAIKRNPLEVLVSPRPGGGFVAVWFLPRRRINVQLLTAEGAPEGPPVRLNAPEVRGVSVLHRADRGFVLLWRRLHFDPDLQGRRFLADGRPTGGTLDLVPGPPAGLRNVIEMAIGPDGTLAFAWGVVDPIAGGGRFIRLRTFDPNGTPLGSAVVVPRWLGSFESSFPEGLAVSADNEVLVIWSRVRGSHDPDRATIYARLYSRTAVPQGAALAPSSQTGSDHPAILRGCAESAGGVWVFAWIAASATVDDPEPRMQIYVRRFVSD